MNQIELVQAWNGFMQGLLTTTFSAETLRSLLIQTEWKEYRLARLRGGRCGGIGYVTHDPDIRNGDRAVVILQCLRDVIKDIASKADKPPRDIESHIGIVPPRSGLESGYTLFIVQSIVNHPDVEKAITTDGAKTAAAVEKLFIAKLKQRGRPVNIEDEVSPPLPRSAR